MIRRTNLWWIISVIWLVPVQHSYANTPENRLQKADSLYSMGNYQGTLQLYYTLYEDDLVYTPAMLLRMALLHERNQEYPQALYFLNTYFLKTRDRGALLKARELAEKHELQGYAVSDLTFIRSQLYGWLPTLRGVLLVTIALWLGLMVYVKLVRKRRLKILPVGMFVLLGLYALLLNSSFFHTAIIKTDQTLLMAGPSSASAVEDVIEKGHKVTLLEKDDVWWKIRWGKESKIGYVRASQLLPLQDQVSAN